MNSRHFVITSMVFLIEAGNYELAAHYLIQDAGKGNGHNGSKSIKMKLAGEIRRQHESLRKAYPQRISIEQMREIAGTVYENIHRSLLSNDATNTLVCKENPGI